MGAEAPTRRFGPLFLLFFLSGVSGLVYESIWSRYLARLVGSAALAQVLVLALFMGGMAVGALVAGRVLPRIRAPVVIYGLVEGLIGLHALAFPHLFELAARASYDTVLPALGGGGAVALAQWGIAALLILPPCVLLGATFPLMSVGILRRERRRAGEVLAVLYFSNSLGAALGALLSGFALVPWVGLPGALMFAAALNVAIMLVAVRDRGVAAPIAATPKEIGSPHLRWLFIAVAFGTGLSSFLYEVGWMRLLAMILGSATHSFEVMLSAFVLGLALGGFWIRKRMDRFQRPELVLAIVQLAMGLCAIATLPAYILAVQAMGGMMGKTILAHTAWLTGDAQHRTVALWYGFNVLRYVVCLMIMLPATFCAGMTLPLLTHVMLRRGHSEAVVGHVYGVNTLGAIVGAAVGGLVLMPIVMLKGLVVVGAFVDMMLALLLLRGHIGARVLRYAGIGALAATVGGLAFPIDPAVLTSTVYRHGGTTLPEDHRLLSYVDGRTASVSVVEDISDAGYRIIYSNGKPDASVALQRWPPGRDETAGPHLADDEPNQFLLGLVPLMARPDAARAALIGFGSGVSCHTLLGSPRLQRLDTVEIEPEMVRGARYFMAVNHRAYEDPRSHIVFDDAKAWFATTGTTYDIIVSEPTNPWVSGVSSLFTVEFYREIERFIAPRGVLAQWIQGYELSDELVLSVLAAIDREFEDYLVIRIGGRDWLILSSPHGPVGTLSPDPLAWPGTAESFALLGIHDIGQVDGLVVANRRMLHPFLAGRVPNRDAHPLLDTAAERERFLQSSAEFLHALRFTPAPLLEVLGGRQRRPYPRAGIGDRRDPHILYQLEHAALLMRAYEHEDARVPAKFAPEGRVGQLSAELMTRWHERSQQLDTAVDWGHWLTATWDVYRETAAHLPVHRAAWWDEVRAIAAGEGVPSDVAQSIELLDALSARDGERLWPLVTSTLQRDDFPLPIALRTIAGAIALELRGAPADERQQFAARHMAGIGNGDESEDVAYRIVRAWAERQPQ
jgi:predicted membrane-bound spermidine synthase